MAPQKYDALKATEILEKHSRKSKYTSDKFDEFVRLTNVAAKQNEIISKK